MESQLQNVTDDLQIKPSFHSSHELQRQLMVEKTQIIRSQRSQLISFSKYS
ncbi:unnamed protein product [Arabidopsis halleri]